MQVQIAEMCSHPQVELRIKTSDSFLSLHVMFTRRFLATKLPHWLERKESCIRHDEANGRPRTALNKINAENASLFRAGLSYFLQVATCLLLTSRGGLQNPDDGWAGHVIHNACSEHRHCKHLDQPESERDLEGKTWNSWWCSSLMSLLSHSQTVVTTAGDSRCPESLTH